MLDSEPLLVEYLDSRHMHDTADESDETLSLCDLPLYSQDQTVEEWGEDLSTESQGSSSISSSNQDYFEFSSQELGPFTTTFPPENIIFCGKIIPHKQPHASQKEPSKPVESKKQANIKKKHGWGIFRWKFSPSKSSKGTTPVMQKKTYSTNKRDKGYDFPVQKMSILTSSSSGKARWYLVFFGISRLSTEVVRRDIKNRQSRRYSSAAAAPPPSPAIIFQTHHDRKTSVERDRSSGLWGLIRVLSCGTNHPDTMVSSISSSPPRKRF